MIATESSRQIACPCGCGARVSSISGTVENGSTPVFRALLMSQCRTPNLWVMLITGPWKGCAKDCAVVIRGEWLFETWDILATSQHEIAEFLYKGG